MLHGKIGLYSVAETPERPPLGEIAFGTGWTEFDEIFKFYPGQLVIVTGNAGNGKSTFLLNILLNIARDQSVSSFMYVPENEQYILETMRLLWSGDDKSFQNIARTKLFIQCATPHIYNEDYEAECKDIYWVLQQAKFAIEKEKVKIVLIDPWNELERACPKGTMMTDYIGMCLMLVKRFCRDHDVTVIMVAHPTKAVNDGEGREPRLADIEGSMNWHNKADNGLVIVRKVDDQAIVRSKKVRLRGAGKIGSCSFKVDPNTGIFTPQYGSAMPGDGKPVGFAHHR